MQTKNLDVVYTVKEKEDNEELRYSLRSICANMPHKKVLIAGYKPSWLKNVRHIAVPQNSGTKYKNSGLNIRTACRDQRVSEDFILMNDDFFVLQPIDSLPLYHKGSMEHMIEIYSHINSVAYLEGMKRTKAMLEALGYHNPKCYEMHLPMIFNKTKRLQMSELNMRFNTTRDNIHLTTLYYNFFRMGGTERTDVKVYKEDKHFDKNSTFLSTTDDTFNNGKVGEFIRARFPEPCKYEV